jgi:hypothetical protein
MSSIKPQIPTTTPPTCSRWSPVSEVVTIGADVSCAATATLISGLGVFTTVIVTHVAVAAVTTSAEYGNATELVVRASASRIDRLRRSVILHENPFYHKMLWSTCETTHGVYLSKTAGLLCEYRPAGRWKIPGDE